MEQEGGCDPLLSRQASALRRSLRARRIRAADQENPLEGDAAAVRHPGRTHALAQESVLSPAALRATGPLFLLSLLRPARLPGRRDRYAVSLSPSVLVPSSSRRPARGAAARTGAERLGSGPCSRSTASSSPRSDASLRARRTRSPAVSIRSKRRSPAWHSAPTSCISS